MNTAKGIIIRLKNVSPATWVRLAFLVLALVNIGLQVFGIGTFDFGSETAEKIASLLAAVIAAAAGFWKNNSFTQAAQEADRILKALKKNAGFVLMPEEDK